MKWKTIAEFFGKIAKSRNSTTEIAWGAAIGTFISIFPTFGLGTPIVLLLSRIFKFNLAIALATSLISNPFTSPFFMVLNYMVGTIFLHNTIVFDIDNWKADLKEIGVTILIGSFFVSGIMATIAFYFSKYMVRKFRNDKEF